MTAAIPPYGAPPAVRIEFRRGSLRAVLIGLPLLGFFTVLLVLGAIWPEKILSNVDHTTGRWISGCFGCFFGTLLLAGLLGIPGLMRRRGVDVDQHGITWWDGETRMPIPWQGIAAVGVGYMISPAPGQVVRTKQGQALEIYSTGHRFEQRFPPLAEFLVTEAPPRSGLPEHRYRIQLPPLDNAASQVEQGVRRFAPHLWLGHYQRKWHRIPGT